MEKFNLGKIQRGKIQPRLIYSTAQNSPVNLSISRLELSQLAR